VPNIIERFSKYLTNIEYPKQKTSWNIAGIIKNENAFYKFDVRDMFKLPDGDFAQKSKANTKADKLVLETEDKWFVVDTNELYKYLKKNKLKKIHINEILLNLDWNIVLLK
jgi:hypothetical protein